MQPSPRSVRVVTAIRTLIYGDEESDVTTSRLLKK
jgi:hypothetical protein